MEALQQANVYQALLEQGASHQQAMALATSPQVMAQSGGAYWPQAPELKTFTNASGESFPMQVINAGGGAGHGLTMSGIPITEPSGQTGGNSAQGLPGSSTLTLSAIDQAKRQGLAGEDLLQTIPRDYQDLVRAYLNGDIG